LETDGPGHCSIEENVSSRTISFHFLEEGCYENRRNRREAAYVAEMVRTLLARQDGRTIGVVAFSEAQQGEIEEAFDELAESDRVFRKHLDAEMEREEEGEFLGLFVKNLENVQGDERDIVIISVCYGPDPRGKMRMNFGPINKGGGEQRLNVIFSRARHHMAIVSSIHGAQITNDYNAGANCLKQFLDYAETVSLGDDDSAQALLQRIGGCGPEIAAGPSDRIVQELEGWLRSEGYEVDRGLGQSSLRCDLAVFRPGDPQYRLGLLIEGPAFHGDTPLFERFVHRPLVLDAFGWAIFPVLANDWIHRREVVQQAVLKALESGEVLPAAKESEAETEAVAEEGAFFVEEAAQSVYHVDRSPDFSRRLEYRKGRSAKFYEVEVTGCEVVVNFGRIGTDGQRLLYQEESRERAKRKANKLLDGKRAKGYLEVGGSADNEEKVES